MHKHPNDHLKAFDESAAFTDQIEPAMKALHNACQRVGLPLVVGICVGADQTPAKSAWKSAESVFFNGPGKTPDELLLAHAFITGGIQDGIQAVMAYMERMGMGACVEAHSLTDAGKALSAAMRALGQDPAAALVRGGLEPDFTGEHAGKTPGKTRH